MRNKSLICNHARRAVATCVVSFAAFLLFSQSGFAGNWNGIEPLKSRRADVERILGQPIKAQPGQNGTLHFNVAGGNVTVAFVNAKFVEAKRLQPELEGTVLQVVLQHENSSDTPESMGLIEKSAFKREEGPDRVTKFSNLDDGIVYTFIGGRLKTTYFTPSKDQWSKAQK